MTNDHLRVYLSERDYDNGGDESVWSGWLANSTYRPQDNNLCTTYNDGHIDYVHEL